MTKHLKRYTPIGVIALTAALVLGIGLGTADRDVKVPPSVNINKKDLSDLHSDMVSFCRQTAEMRATAYPKIEALARVGLRNVKPDQIADVIDALDLSGLEPEKMPVEIRDDVVYLMKSRDDAVKTIRDAPESAPLEDLIPKDLVQKLASLIEISNANCGGG